MSDFKVGDKVRFLEDYNGKHKTRAVSEGEVGTIVATEPDRPNDEIVTVDLGDPGREDVRVFPRRLAVVSSKPLAFRVGDKVAPKFDSVGHWAGTIISIDPNHPNGWVYRVRFDAHPAGAKCCRYKEGELQYAPIPDKPKRKFQVGDRVRVLGDTAGWDHDFPANTVGTVIAAGIGAAEGYDGTGYTVRGKADDEWDVAEADLTAFAPQEFKLRVGDKIRNTLTGREGVVYEAPISRTLKVYDLKPPYKDGVPVAAVEEYEFWHPGTYEYTHRTKIGPF